MMYGSLILEEIAILESILGLMLIVKNLFGILVLKNSDSMI
jgi:hypothetical protein